MTCFFINQYVSIVSILYLKYIAYHRVGSLTFDEVFPRNYEVLRLRVSVAEIV
jgi:hypothetical protein